MGRSGTGLVKEIRMNADKTLNDILVKLFNDLMEIEENA